MLLAATWVGTWVTAKYPSGDEEVAEWAKAVEKAKKAGARPPLPPYKDEWIELTPPRCYITCSKLCHPMTIARTEKQRGDMDKPAAFRSGPLLHADNMGLLVGDKAVAKSAGRQQLLDDLLAEQARDTKRGNWRGSPGMVWLTTTMMVVFGT
jgi:hypothetical protein